MASTCTPDVPSCLGEQTAYENASKCKDCGKVYVQNKNLHDGTCIFRYKGYIDMIAQSFMNQVLRNWRFNRHLRHWNDPMQQQFCLCLPSNCLAIKWTVDSGQTLQCHMHVGKHRKNIAKPEGRSCHHPPAVCQVLCPQQRLHHMRHSQ